MGLFLPCLGGFSLLLKALMRPTGKGGAQRRAVGEVPMTDRERAEALELRKTSLRELGMGEPKVEELCRAEVPELFVEEERENLAAAVRIRQSASVVAPALRAIARRSVQARQAAAGAEATRPV
jgi:hypothetical protein